MLAPPNDRVIYSVSQLNNQIRQMLEGLPLLWIEGEISNLSRPSSGHWYFTLKDAQAQVRCAMFRNRNGGLRFAAQDGQKVLVRAKVSLYEGRGDYQLIVEHMEPAGLGDLQRQFELLKAQLDAEGLFASANKKPLPFLPQRIGLITSPTGAAIRDLIQVLGRRFPAVPLVVLPVAVQGKDAAGEIAQAIAKANTLSLCDLLIVGRGGGSLEDLWAFNEEIVARAIVASRIPIISAVGHETDVTIADFVADLRAPTPSAAAELAVPHHDELAQMFAGRLTQLKRALARRLDKHHYRLEALNARLRHPGQRVRMHQQRVDMLELRLRNAWQKRYQQAHQQLAKQQALLHQHNPKRKLALRQQQLQQLQARLPLAWARLLHNHQQRLAQNAALLHSLSPLPTLQRGYTLALNSQGQLIRSVTAVASQQEIRLRFHDGEASVKVL